eukprot:Phypoly_transcript_01856.p1 GENE.Phypoly_transcript_01856~~Phypoly_transcript_01856.p1  ORF type:complete len:861 (+),score=227.50 Phypoly_transcript_01856:499-3081(+)
MDVLEHGKGSAYANHFDITWETHQDRLLVPFLGSPIGSVLANGELKVQWNEKEEVASAEGHPIGALQIHYYASHFPIDPSTLPAFILEPALKSLSGASATHLQQIITQLKQLPTRDTIGELSDSNAGKRLERRTKAHEAKAALSKLIREDKEVHKAVFSIIDHLNDKKQLATFTQLVEAQAYRLSYWKLASDELNYRRFFDINELLAIKSERREVFEESLQLVAQWIKSGHVDALRLDHPDGLYDPAKYFSQLQDHIKRFLPATFKPIDSNSNRPLYVLVEKILEPGESLITDWPVSGTVGYEYLNLVNNIFVNTEKETAMRKVYQDFIENTDAAQFNADFHELLYNSKKLLLNSSFEAELNPLALLLQKIAKKDMRTVDFSAKQLKQALVELIACFPVYRTYITQETPKPTAEDAARIAEAVKGVRKHDFVDSLIVDFVEHVVLCRDEEGLDAETRAQRRHFTMKLQQLTGPVMAKGLEDTSFYRFFLLTSLNEVGGDPNTFGVTLADFHKYNLVRNRDWPQAMSNSSTHDTKRSEDVRARINVLSEIPAVWNRAVVQWRERNAKHKRVVEPIGLVPEPNEEYLIYQTLVGIWPFEGSFTSELTERVKNYLLKSMKESKLRTTWTKQNKEYEGAVTEFLEKIVKDNEFASSFSLFAQEIIGLGKLNSISQTIVKLTAPGVPDIYQGQELWDFSLVDPDNRRPVDYELRKSLLARVKAAVTTPDFPSFVVTALEDKDNSGLIKMIVTERLLFLRGSHPALFLSGDYQGLQARGDKAQHVIAFARTLGERQVVTVTTRFFATSAILGAQFWAGQTLVIPDAKSGSKYRDVLTNTEHTLDGHEVSLKTLFKYIPFAVLEKIN